MEYNLPQKFMVDVRQIWSASGCVLSEKRRVGEKTPIRQNGLTQLTFPAWNQHKSALSAPRLSWVIHQDTDACWTDMIVHCLLKTWAQHLVHNFFMKACKLCARGSFLYYMFSKRRSFVLLVLEKICFSTSVFYIKEKKVVMWGHINQRVSSVCIKSSYNYFT